MECDGVSSVFLREGIELHYVHFHAWFNFHLPSYSFPWYEMEIWLLSPKIPAYLQSTANAHRRRTWVLENYAPGTIKKAENSAPEEELGQTRRSCELHWKIFVLHTEDISKKGHTLQICIPVQMRGANFISFHFWRIDRGPGKGVELHWSGEWSGEMKVNVNILASTL